MKLTRAQKRMLMAAYGHPNFGLYGPGDFRCARNLMNKGKVMEAIQVVIRPWPKEIS
jgi:hypothetical protein